MIRYWAWVYKNKPPGYFDDKPWEPKNVLVPGWAGDETHQCLRKFEKWYARPIKSHQLYWRLHKNA
jgi:hypothetical protein